MVLALVTELVTRHCLEETSDLGGMELYCQSGKEKPSAPTVRVFITPRSLNVWDDHNEYFEASLDFNVVLKLCGSLAHKSQHGVNPCMAEGKSKP